MGRSQVIHIKICDAKGTVGDEVCRAVCSKKCAVYQALQEEKKVIGFEYQLVHGGKSSPLGTIYEGNPSYQTNCKIYGSTYALLRRAPNHPLKVCSLVALTIRRNCSGKYWENVR